MRVCKVRLFVDKSMMMMFMIREGVGDRNAVEGRKREKRGGQN